MMITCRSLSGHPQLKSGEQQGGHRAGTSGPPDGAQDMLSKAKAGSILQQRKLLPYLSGLQCQEMSHDKPIWTSRSPSCPLYQVSSWYVVLPAWPVSLESTVELSNAENHNEDPVRVQESSELLICKLWPLPLNLDHPPTSRLPAPYLQPLQPASPASNMPHLLPPQGLCTFYSGLLEHLHGFLAHFLRHSPHRHHSKEPCVTLPPNP